MHSTKYIYSNLCVCHTYFVIDHLRLWQYLPAQHQQTRSVLGWQGEGVPSVGAAVWQCCGRRSPERDTMVQWREDKCVR